MFLGNKLKEPRLNNSPKQTLLEVTNNCTSSKWKEAQHMNIISGCSTVSPLGVPAFIELYECKGREELLIMNQKRTRPVSVPDNKTSKDFLESSFLVLHDLYHAK